MRAKRTDQHALTYTTLDGEVLDLSSLTTEERAHFERCYAGYRSGNVGWGAFTNLVSGPENPLLRPSDGRVTRAVWRSPLFTALRDLEDRVGLRTGELAPDREDEALLARDPVADSWLPAPQAAGRKGVTLSGLHQAIRRGEVIAGPATPGGSRLVVSENSLERWTPVAIRQTAGRARAIATRATG
jgi:hypothetical protein